MRNLLLQNIFYLAFSAIQNFLCLMLILLNDFIFFLEDFFFNFENYFSNV